jgi:hypothetical protein
MSRVCHVEGPQEAEVLVSVAHQRHGLVTHEPGMAGLPIFYYNYCCGHYNNNNNNKRPHTSKGEAHQSRERKHHFIVLVSEAAEAGFEAASLRPALLENLYHIAARTHKYLAVVLTNISQYILFPF